MRFCSECGSGSLSWRVPDGDTAPRDVCEACGTIHYRNPKIVVGCLATDGDEVLLCRRAIEPRLGLWTLPAGFMENGETIAAGAIRETLEEHFHYRNLDVSTLKELARRWAPDVAKSFSKESKHTALADVHEAIDELRHYRRNFILGGAGDDA